MAIDITYSHSVFHGQIHCPAPVTPFAANGDLMLDAFAELLRWYIDDINVDGLLIAGSNGEGYVLNAEELGKVTETVVETVKGRVPFFVHVSRISSRETIMRAQIVAEAGAPGLCLTGQPYIQTATKAEIVERFEKVAKAVPLPVMVYNSFTHQQYNITPDVMRALCDVAPICVVKDSPPSFKEALALFVELGDRFPILHGISATLVRSRLDGPRAFRRQVQGALRGPRHDAGRKDEDQQTLRVGEGCHDADRHPASRHQGGVEHGRTSGRRAPGSGQTPDAERRSAHPGHPDPSRHSRWTGRQARIAPWTSGRRKRGEKIRVQCHRVEQRSAPQFNRKSSIARIVTSPQLPSY